MWKITNYVWFKTLFEPNWEQLSLKNKKQSKFIEWNLAKFTCE